MNLKRLWRYVKALFTGRLDARRTPLQQAAILGNVEDARLLLDKGADIEAGDDEMTPLRLAIYGGHVAMVRLLIERGARTDGRGIKHALTVAHYYHYSEVTEILKEAGRQAQPR